MDWTGDDFTIYFSNRHPQQVKEVLERELEEIAVWIEQNKLYSQNTIDGSELQM